jgi:hypothetical protein
MTTATTTASRPSVCSALLLAGCAIFATVQAPGQAIAQPALSFSKVSAWNCRSTGPQPLYLWHRNASANKNWRAGIFLPYAT